MRRLVMILMVAALAGAACSSGSDDSASGDGASVDFCENARQIVDGSTLLQDVDFNDTDATRVAFEDFKTLVDNAASSAPSEIADDVALVKAFFDEFLTALEAADYNAVAALGALGDSSIDQEELTAANARVSDYTSSECGIDTPGIDELDPTAGQDASTTTEG